MRVFYGGPIQGAKDRRLRAHIHSGIINYIKESGFEVSTEHTTGKTKEEAASLLEESIGPLPPLGIERTRYVRKKMIEAVEGEINAAVFEVSIPSLGTGIEIAHAYLRPKMGLKEIPILALYEKDYWPNNLSSMIRGIDEQEIDYFSLIEYENLADAEKHVRDFLLSLKSDQ